jgi:uncharacterized protein (DUF2164 family)
MTLTKKSLLAETPKPTAVECEGRGTIYVKPLTEFQRSKRLAALWSDKDATSEDARMKMRVHVIVDQLCDEMGKNLFNEGDVKDLLALESSKLDSIVEAISSFNDEYCSEKNDPAE